jgi:hypothetical protein
MKVADQNFRVSWTLVKVSWIEILVARLVLVRRVLFQQNLIKIASKQYDKQMFISIYFLSEYKSWTVSS